MSGFATPGIAADAPANPPVEMDLPGVQVSVVAGNDPPCPDDSGDVLDQEFSDADAEFDFSVPDGEFPVRVAGRLIGEWVTVVNCADDPYCQGGDPLVECVGISTPPSEPLEPFRFNLVPSEFGTAQVNGFLVVEGTHDFFKNLQPTWTEIDRNVTCAVNVSMSCMARYDYTLDRLSFAVAQESGGCRNTAFSTIITHEYGHFIQDRLFGLSPDFASDSFNEGAADALAGLMWNTPLIGVDWFGDGDWMRNIDTPNVHFDCHSSTHYCGLALAGAFWDARRNLIDACEQDPECNAPDDAIDTVNHLFADFLFVSDGWLDESVLVEVLIVDDDDLDLSNGTPHSEQIIPAFRDDHGWPDPTADPDGSVVVEWVGPSSGPEPGVDYAVHYEVDPPNVTLLTTEKGGDPVEFWHIGRVVDEEAADLGTITAQWAPPSIYDVFAVEVGTTPTTPVRHVSVVEIPAQSTSNWSNVRLALAGDLKSRVQCYADNNDEGGRVFGTIQGDARNVVAQGIGEGTSTPGTLSVGGTLRRSSLATLADGSVISADTLYLSLLIDGDLSGTIAFGTVHHEPVWASAQIRIAGDALETATITIGDPATPGDGLVEGTVVVAGTYAGTMTIDEMQHRETAPEIEVGRLAGTIRISQDLIGVLTISGSGLSKGDIWIDGDLADDGAIQINGDMCGDILANADGVDGGDILGNVTVLGEFNGNICGDNLEYGGPFPLPLPDNIHIPNLGPQGTICGFPPDCPAATIVGADPADGTVDARQPHPVNSQTPRQGIGWPEGEGGRPEDQIVISRP